MGTSIARFDKKIQRGRGKAAHKLGQTYDVRRLDGATNFSVTSNKPVLTGFAARIRRTTSRLAVENQTFDLLTFIAICDNRKLRVGDVAIETGYESMSSGVYTAAQIRPTRETIWVRTEFNVSISRPNPGAGSAAQQPSSFVATAPQAPQHYGAIDKSSEEVLTLTNGLYSFSATPGATPASIQAGLQPLNRIKDGNQPKLPTALYREHFLLYLPMLPGEQINELDRINFPNSDRYEVALVYTSDQAGLVGYICVVEKLST